MKTVLSILIAAVTTVSLAGGYSIKSKASDFTLENTDGKKVSLSNYANAKGFIVTFTCNHCPYAKMYESRIMALDKKYASKGFPVIAISSNDAVSYPDDSFENMKKRASNKGYTFPYLYDESQDVAKAFGAQKTPHIYVLSKKNNDFIVEYIGAIDNYPRDESGVSKRYVEDAVDNLLAGKAVEKTESKAIGCGIKWK